MTNPQQPISPMLERCARSISEAEAREGVWGDDIEERVARVVERSWRKHVANARACLQALMDVDDKTLHAAFVAMNETPGGTRKEMKAQGKTPKELFVAKMIPRWQAMIRSLLGESK